MYLYSALFVVSHTQGAQAWITQCYLCSIDLSKAFDKVNHHGLYLKLTKRRIPVELLLLVFDNLFSGCSACVKWNDAWSATFTVSFGVRQGSVLSPFLFNIYLDDIARINDCTKRKFIIVYADDIQINIEQEW